MSPISFARRLLDHLFARVMGAPDFTPYRWSNEVHYPLNEDDQ
jgi:hypothetical protein